MTAQCPLTQMRAAGFTLELDGAALVVSPADKLSDEQRAYIRTYKPALVQLLMDETAPATVATAATVTCSTCQHGIPASSDPWSWHSCGQGVDRATGWGMVGRKCEQWETRP